MAIQRNHHHHTGSAWACRCDGFAVPSQSEVTFSAVHLTRGCVSHGSARGAILGIALYVFPLHVCRITSPAGLCRTDRLVVQLWELQRLGSWCNSRDYTTRVSFTRLQDHLTRGSVSYGSARGAIMGIAPHVLPLLIFLRVHSTRGSCFLYLHVCMLNGQRVTRKCLRMAFEAARRRS